MTKQIELIKYWTYQTLPQVYDESLSFSELLYSVISKVNELIESSNEYFDQDLVTYVTQILQEWEDTGKLETIVNESINVPAGLGVFAESFKRLPGEEDDSPRLQRAIDHAVSIGRNKLILTSPLYTIHEPLNLTDISGGFEIEGLGMDEGGTTILGLTGYIMLDFAGTRTHTLKNIRLAGDGSQLEKSSTVGIFLSRTTANQYVEFGNFENVRIDLPTIPSANDGNGTIGIYNYAAELARYRNIYVTADRPACFFGKNSYNLSSRFTNIVSGFQSMSAVVVDGKSTLTALGRPALSVDTATDMKFDVYLNRWGTPGLSNIYAVELSGAMNTFKLTGHVEDFVGLIYGIGVISNGFEVKVTKHIIEAGKPQIVFDGTAYNNKIEGASISVIPMLNTEFEYNVIEQAGTIHAGITNSEITLHPKQNLHFQYGYGTGTRITCEDDSNWLVLPAGGYADGLQVTTRKGHTIYGMVNIPNGFDNFGGKKLLFGGGPPTDGTWAYGDKIMNNFPLQGDYIGWVCLEASSGPNPQGLWRGFGLIQTW